MANILLAEDDTSMRQFLSLALTKAGHSVTAHENGLDALNALQTDSDELFDLLLTDIVMPGMDGIELAQTAAQKSPKIKVMFITGFAAVAMGQKAGQPEGPKILSKPFHLKELVDKIELLLKTG